MCSRVRDTRVHGGMCRSCYERTRREPSLCAACGQTRRIPVDGHGICHSCRSLESSRKRGISPARRRPSDSERERELVGRFSPLRRAWIHEFLDTAYLRRAASTRANLLRSLVRFDAFLSAEPDVGAGQWSLATVEHVDAYLSEGSRFRLQPARMFFRWMHRRKGGVHALDGALPRPPRLFRPRVLPLDEARRLYARWTSPDAPPTEALVGLLGLVHCLRAGEIRYVRMDDVLAGGRIRVGESVIDLTLSVAAALERYLRWRSEWYDGPSRYLIVSRASRLHNRPVSANWFTVDLLPEISVAALRQTAIQRLIQGASLMGCSLRPTRGCRSTRAASTCGRSAGERAGRHRFSYRAMIWSTMRRWRLGHDEKDAQHVEIRRGISPACLTTERPFYNVRGTPRRLGRCRQTSHKSR